MAIKVGENPETMNGYNKFIGKNGEGHRGKIIAITEDKSEAIIIAMTTSCHNEDGVIWGKLYLIKELNTEEYPNVIKQVSRVPNTRDWTIL